MIDFNKAVIDVIRRRRTSLKISQAGFAGKIGMTPRGYRYVEHGQTPLSIQRLSEIAIAFELPVATLCEEAEFFINIGRLPERPFQSGETCASALDQLRRRNPSWCSALSPELCEADQE